mmetsp:Transcript_15723/g.37969  ORF Transcript_15723/g.37969 Transcript_15723/m.37969 type:complete len:377 (-) Transcript_15723:308-1438(-)
MGKDRPKLEGDALIDAVQQALETVLERDNVPKNAVVSAAMDPQTFVPVAVLAKVGEIRKLTKDKSVLVQAAEKSEQLSLNSDNSMIKPNYKARRNIVIVREVPENSTEAQVKELFKAPHDANVESVKEEHNNTWFVTFTSDEAAQEAALAVRLSKATLNGTPVSVAIKSDHLKKSYIAAEEAHKVHMQQMMASMQYMMMAQAAAAYQHKGKGKGLGGQYPPGPPAKASSKNSRRASREKAAEEPVDDQPEADDPGPVKYSHEFRKYSRQELIDMCSAMKEVPLADGFEECRELGLLVTGEADRKWVEDPQPEKPAASEEPKPEKKEGKGEKGRSKGKGRGKGAGADAKPKAAPQQRSSTKGYGSGPRWVVKKPAGE